MDGAGWRWGIEIGKRENFGWVIKTKIKIINKQTKILFKRDTLTVMRLEKNTDKKTQTSFRHCIQLSPATNWKGSNTPDTVPTS